jgi:hypothetical protein
MVPAVELLAGRVIRQSAGVEIFVGWLRSAMSQIRTVLSVLLATTVRLSGLNATELMKPENPLNGSEIRCGRLGSAISHNWTAWSSAAVATVRP